MRGKRETWNWPLSRQDANPSSWIILDCMGLNATFRAFPTLQDSSSLSREGGVKEQESGDRLRPYGREQWTQARGEMSGWSCLICVIFLLTILLELIYQGPPDPTSLSTKVSSGMREQSSGIFEKISSLEGNRGKLLGLFSKSYNSEARAREESCYLLSTCQVLHQRF